MRVKKKLVAGGLLLLFSLLLVGLLSSTDEDGEFGVVTVSVIHSCVALVLPVCTQVSEGMLQISNIR